MHQKNPDNLRNITFFFGGGVSRHHLTLREQILKVRSKFQQIEETFKMVEERDGEITSLPTNISKIHLHVEQPPQNTF